MKIQEKDLATGISRTFIVEGRLDWWQGSKRISKGPWVPFEDVTEHVGRIAEDLIVGAVEGKELHVLARKIQVE